MKFNLTLNQEDVSKSYQKALKEAAKTVTIKGFRKGKAPLKVVEQNVEKSALYELVLQDLVPGAYNSYIKEHNLKPITQPRIKLVNYPDDNDWEVEIEIAEKPKVKLNNYKDAVKSEKAKDTIWTPDKAKKADDPKGKEKEDTKESDKINKILSILIETCEVEIPDLLVEQEVNRQLSQLLDQINKLGLTLEQYLESLGKDVELLKKEYAANAVFNLKIDFILDAIATEEKLQVEDKELNQFIEKVQDEKVKAKLESDEAQKLSIRYSLTRQKVVDYLMSL